MPTNEYLHEAYDLFGVNSIEELANAFVSEDQRLIKNGEWDYTNPNLLLNRVMGLVECTLDEKVQLSNPEDIDDLKDMLWFWYHHAIGQAVWGTKDRAAAQRFSEKALQYLISENPNKITKLLYFLVRDMAKEANDLFMSMDDELNKNAAREILSEYSAGRFFK